jgi:peptidoglycan hydrolase CwlO-like protein
MSRWDYLGEVKTYEEFIAETKAQLKALNLSEESQQKVDDALKFYNDGHKEIKKLEARIEEIKAGIRDKEDLFNSDEKFAFGLSNIAPLTEERRKKI